MFTEGWLPQWATVHGLVVLLGLGLYVIASHTLRQRRHPSAAIAWVVSLVLLPYLALPLYLVFGTRKLARVRQLPKAPQVGTGDDGPDPVDMADQLALALGLADAVGYTDLAIHQDGAQALAALQRLIAGATETLDLCTFILGRDRVGDDIAERLIARAQAGVRVRLLIDGIGYYLGGRPRLAALAAAGVQVCLFVPPWRSRLLGRTNLRNHRKLVLADGSRLWCGGRNLAAEYFTGALRAGHLQPPWTDLSFDLGGALVLQGQQRFEQDWLFAHSGAFQAPPAPTLPIAREPQQPRARLVASGPDQVDDTVYTLLVSGCFTARQRLLAVTPYFVPEPALLMAMVLAARRGVVVDLLLPRQSNHHLADIARNAALRELAAAGARIWLLPHMVHAKAVVIDDTLALVGSANLDDRSLFLNYELMVAFEDPAEVQRFAGWIWRQQAPASQAHLPAPGLLRDLVEGLVRWVAFQL